MNKLEYAQYLQSEHWRTLSRLRREFDGDACAICGSEHPLQVHHRTYERCPYLERLSDIVTLCDKCHELYHEKLGRLK